MANQTPLSQHSRNWYLLSKPHLLLTLLSVTDTLKAPLSCWFDWDHSCFSSFLTSSCQSSLLPTFTKTSHLHLIIFNVLTYFICSPCLHVLSSLILYRLKVFPFWALLFHLFFALSMKLGLMSVPLHWLPSSLSFSHLCMSRFSCASLSFFFIKLYSVFSLPAYSMCKHYSISQVLM